MGTNLGGVVEWFLRGIGHRWQSVVLVALLVLGVVASAALFVVLSGREQTQIRRDFEGPGQERIAALRRTLVFDFLEVEATQRFLANSNEVERQEFARFVAPLSRDRPSIRSVQWAPRVAYADRSSFEAAAARDGLPGFRISPFVGQSPSRPFSTTLRDECYPVFYSEPVSDAVPGLGTDLATNPAWLEAMDRACDTGKMAATSMTPLPHAAGDGTGVRLFCAVYQKNAALSTVDERRRHLAGFVVGALSLKDVFAESLAALTPSGVDVRLLDRSNPRHPTLLFEHRSRLRKSVDAKVAPLPSSDLSLSETFDVGGRRWTVFCVAVPEFMASRITWYPTAITLAALLLTGLLTAYLVGIAVHTGRTTRLAVELRRANQLLENEVADRKHVESTLWTSELKYKTLYDASSDAIMYAEPGTGMLAGNPATVRLFGFSDEKEFVSFGPADLSPEYQPDGSLSSVKAQEVMALAMERGSNLFEWKHRRLDGSEFFATVLLTRIELEGRPLMLSTVRDITQQKQMEEALKASESRFRDVLHASRDAMLLLDGERFVACNETAAKMLGYSTADECLLIHPGQLSPPMQPDGRSSHEKAVEMIQIAKREGFHRFEWVHQKANGEDLLVEVSLTAVVVEGKNQLITHWRDISVQKRTEEALRTSERQHRLFAENVTDVIWTTDLSGRFTYISPSVEHLLGIKSENGVRMSVADVIAPSSIALAQDRLQTIAAAAQSGQRLKVCEKLEQIRADGSTVWTEVNGSGLYDESGRLVGFLGITHDITVRRQAEERQLHSLRRLEGVNRLEEELLLRGPIEQKFKKITETAVDLLDLDFCRIWMIRPSDLCEQGCSHAAASEDLAPCARGEKCLHLMASAGRYTHIDGSHRRVPIGAYKIGRIASGDDHKFLTNHVTTDPRVHDHPWAESLGLVSFAGYKLRDVDGNAIGVLAMFAKHPISEEDDAFITNLAEMTSRVIMDEQAADALEKENAKLSAMISGMEEGVVFADVHNVIVEINDYLCRFAGLDRSATIGKCLEDIHQGKTLESLIEKIEYFRQTPGAEPFVLQRAMGNAEVILRMQPIYRGGRYDGVLLNVIDVSELVKARREAELANQAKSRFLANMSHEIRTPMTAILGYADLLMDPRINASNRNNYSAIIHRSGEHLLTLINDILDLSKIESGKFLLEMEPCNLVSLLADVSSLMRPRAESRGISFSVEYTGALPETIITDGSRLRQAIINLAGNAVKFTERGSVRMVVSFLPGWRVDQPGVKIEVIDTGIGIRPEVLPSLFQPFSQGDSKVAQRFGGTGLGLAISRHIATMLGGELNLTSVWGEGSRFTLTVPTGNLAGVRMLQNPVEAEHETNGHAWRATTKDLAGVRVLLAEDGFDNRELICTILRTAGAEVETAENGRIALEKIQIAPFDVILMDMNMPEMDGYEATRSLRAQGYEKPILALTANAMDGDSAQCISAGCNEHLAKPINRPHLIHTIARYVCREAPADREVAAPAIETAYRNEEPTVFESIVSEFIDDPDMAEIIGGFVGRLGSQCVAMREAVAEGQYDDLRRLAHMLKGAGGSYGYPTLTDACRMLEEAARENDHAAANAALDHVDHIIRTIENGFTPNVTTQDTSP